MSDNLVMYEVTFVGEKKKILCVGISDKDIVNSVTEWSGDIQSMNYIGDDCYITEKAAKKSLE